MLRCFLSLILLICSLNFSFADNLTFPSFKEGLYRNGRSESNYIRRFIREKNKSVLAEAIAKRDLYNKMYGETVENILSRSHYKVETIPKIIHLIWLGSPFPERYEEWSKTWKAMDGWEYRLWTDKDVEELELVNRELFDASKNYGEKSDILRYEILYQFGGLYVDTDFACFNPDYFEAFHHSLNFYIGFIPIEYVLFRMGNSIIGSAPQHPFLLQLITDLKENYHKNKGAIVMETTGTAFFTKTMEDYLSKGKENQLSVSIFPASFFYPFTHNEIITEVQRWHNPIKDDDVSPETCAIHFWDGSWSRNEVK